MVSLKVGLNLCESLQHHVNRLKVAPMVNRPKCSTTQKLVCWQASKDGRSAGQRHLNKRFHWHGFPGERLAIRKFRFGWEKLHLSSGFENAQLGLINHDHPRAIPIRW